MVWWPGLCGKTWASLSSDPEIDFMGRVSTLKFSLYFPGSIIDSDCYKNMFNSLPPNPEFYQP